MDAMMSAAVASLSTSAAVPEPACLSLAICGGFLIVYLRWRTA